MILLISSAYALSININTPLLLIPTEEKPKGNTSTVYIGRPNCDLGRILLSEDYSAKDLALKTRGMGLSIASLKLKNGCDIYLNTSGEIQYRIEVTVDDELLLRYPGVYDDGLLLDKDFHVNLAETVSYISKQISIKARTLNEH